MKSNLIDKYERLGDSNELYRNILIVYFLFFNQLQLFPNGGIFMKTMFRRLSSALLTVIFLFTLIPTNAFAANKVTSKSQEALNFIESKGFLIGDIIDIDITSDGFIFEVQYLSNGEHSLIEYHEKDNGIELVFVEGNARDTFLFNANGNVYLNSALLHNHINNYIARDSGGYIYQYYKTRLAAINAWGNFTHGPETCYTDIIPLTLDLSSSSKPAVAYVIAFYFGAPAASFYEEAETLINLAVSIAYAENYIDLVYCKTEDTTRWPLQKMTGYEIYFKLFAYQVTSELWEIRTLN